MNSGSVLNVRNTPGLLAVRVHVAHVVLLVHHELGNTLTSISTFLLILITICMNTTDVLSSNGVGDNRSGVMVKLQMFMMSILQVDTVRLLRFSVAVGYLLLHQRLIVRVVKLSVHGRFLRSNEQHWEKIKHTAIEGVDQGHVHHLLNESDSVQERHQEVDNVKRYWIQFSWILRLHRVQMITMMCRTEYPQIYLYAQSS